MILNHKIPINDDYLTIKEVRGHFEVYVDGKFSFSADSIREIEEELYSLPNNSKD